MKKIIILISVCALIAICFSVISFAADTPDIDAVVTVGEESTVVSPSGKIFCLPAAADVTKLSLSFDGELTYQNSDGSYSGKITSGQTLDLTRAAATDERGVPCYKLTLTAGGKSGIFTFYADENISSVFVTTSQGLPYIESNKENKDTGAKITVINESGEIEYSDTAASTASEIKGRGNATFSYYKKPYQIKLAEKTAILGMDKAKTYILLANYTDQSALHNALAFELGEALGVPYNIEYNFVNLYIDGEYRGLYMICEKVQIDSARIDITDLEKATEKANPNIELDELNTVHVTNNEFTKTTIITEYQYVNVPQNPADITGGYLVELDNNYGTGEPCYFKTQNGNVYVVKSPEYASRAEVEYIARIFSEMEEAIYSETGYNSAGKHFSEYIDMESFSAVYTVQELMKNWDAYTSSMFFFKDADKDGTMSKIYMGPLWDLDNTLGNIQFDYNFGIDTSYLWAQDGVFQSYVRTFAKNLMKHSDFKATNANVYQTAYEEVQKYLAKGGWFEQTSEKIYSSVMMDRTRWEMYDSNRWLLNSSGRKVSVKFIQFAEYGKWDDQFTVYTKNEDAKNATALGFMRYYLSARAEALLKSLGNGKPVTPPPGSGSSTTGTTGTTSTTGSTSTAGSSGSVGTTGSVSSSASTHDTISSSTMPGAAPPKDTPAAYIAPIAIFGGVAAASAAVLIIIKKRK